MPAAFATKTWSCTTVPAVTVVTGPDAVMMSVRAVAAAHIFVAAPELPPVPSVCRVSESPPTGSVTCALTTVAPVTFETSVIEQLPVPPEVVHGFADVNAPGPESIVKLIDVPFGSVHETA